MVKFQKDFKIKKTFNFSLDAERDKKTGLSEKDLLEEYAQYCNESVSMAVRRMVLEYLHNHWYLVSERSKKEIRDNHIMKSGIYRKSNSNLDDDIRRFTE
jgi:hypothetical protein